MLLLLPSAVRPGPPRTAGHEPPARKTPAQEHEQEGGWNQVLGVGVEGCSGDRGSLVSALLLLDMALVDESLVQCLETA